MALRCSLHTITNKPSHIREGIHVTTIPFTPKSASSTLVITSSPITGDVVRAGGCRAVEVLTDRSPMPAPVSVQVFGLQLQCSTCCGWCDGGSCDQCSQLCTDTHLLLLCPVGETSNVSDDFYVRELVVQRCMSLVMHCPVGLLDCSLVRWFRGGPLLRVQLAQ